MLAGITRLIREGMGLATFAARAVSLIATFALATAALAPTTTPAAIPAAENAASPHLPCAAYAAASAPAQRLPRIGMKPQPIIKV